MLPHHLQPDLWYPVVTSGLSDYLLILKIIFGNILGILFTNWVFGEQGMEVRLIYQSVLLDIQNNVYMEFFVCINELSKKMMMLNCFCHANKKFPHRNPDYNLQ